MYKTNFSSDIWNLCPWEWVWCPRSNWQFKWVEVKPGLPELGEMSSSYGQFVYVFSWLSAWSTLWVQSEDLCIYTFEAKTQYHVYHTNIAVVLRASVKILANVFLSPSQTNVKSLCQVFFLLWHCMVIDLCWLYVSEKQSYHANALPWVVFRKGTPIPPVDLQHRLFHYSYKILPSVSLLLRGFHCTISSKPFWLSLLNFRYNL